MKIHVIALVVVLILFTSCMTGRSQVPPPISTYWILNICVDKNFSDIEFLHVKFAIDEWDQALGETIELKRKIVDIRDSNQECRVVVQRDFGKSSRFEYWPNRVGLAERLGGRKVWIAIDRQGFQNDKYGLLKLTVVHEIGHAFWLKHSENGVMSSPLRPGEWVGPEDANMAAYMLGVEHGKMVKNESNTM